MFVSKQLLVMQKKLTYQARKILQNLHISAQQRNGENGLLCINTTCVIIAYILNDAKDQNNEN